MSPRIERPAPAELATLARSARQARRRARVPYSKFKVGAALRAIDGTIITGCNVENASYPLTMCAERVAAGKAVSEGLKRFDAIAVIGDSRIPTPPCGACRQVLWEIAGNIWVYLVGPRGSSELFRLDELLPLPFDRRFF